MIPVAEENNTPAENKAVEKKPVEKKAEATKPAAQVKPVEKAEVKPENEAVAKKATKKVAKKTTKKVAKKAAEKVVKKTEEAKPAVKKAKPAVKKAAKKVAKKATAAKKKVAKKVTTKVTKKATKVAKTATKKATAAKKTARKVTKAEAVKVESRIDQLQEMFKENLEGLNETGDKAEALAKNIWLAGLGAYSRAYEEMSERYDDIQDKAEEINEEGQKIFGDLVKRGQDIQSDIEGQVNKGRETLEDRVEEFRTRFGGGLSSFVDIPERLREAAEKVEEIGKKLRGKK